MEIFCFALQFYVIAIFGVIILSWIPVSPGGPFEAVARFLHAVTDPVLLPLRRALPPVRLGGMGLDLSPMVLLFVIEFLLTPLVCGR
jgi:YggT family protein